MRLRTFTAPDMPSAMRQVREALGEDAVILSSESDRGKGVKITAAAEQEEDAPSSGFAQAFPSAVRSAPVPAPKKDEPKRSNPAADQLRFEIQNILRFHNLPELFIAKIIQKASDAELASIISLHGMSHDRSPRQLFRLALEKLLREYFSFAPLPLESPNLRILLAGPPGIGKTLTIAKLATKLSMESGPHRELAVCSTDTKRAGGVEQLQAFTTILGLPLTVVNTAEKLNQHIKSLPPGTRLLIDTAGCNPYKASELAELKQFASLPGIEPVMTLPAGGDSLETIDTVEAFAAAMPVRRLLITRADMARRFGGIVAAAAAHGLSFCNASASSSMSDTLAPVDSDVLAQFLLRYQLQSE
jgi:flagellar biosynthesis protein FlhF